MAVRVDESGAHDFVRRIDPSPRLSVRQVAHHGDALTTHADVHPPRGRTRSIDEHPSADEEVEWFAREAVHWTGVRRTPSLSMRASITSPALTYVPVVAPTPDG